MDNVHQPNHCTHGDIETIDYIRDKLTKEEFMRKICNASNQN